jgi:hypothetical protein
MSTVAQEVAELIHADAQSGSASWDEVGGPSAVLTQVSPTKYTVALPARYTDEDEDQPTGATCLITVESTEGSSS